MSYLRPTTSRTRRILAVAIFAVVVLAFSAYFWARSNAGETPEVVQEPAAALSVETIYAMPDMYTHTLTAHGSIAAVSLAQVAPRVSGVAITGVYADVGQMVNAGDVLATFDNQAAEQAHLGAQADVAAAEASLMGAQNEYERILPLLEIDAVSAQEVQTRKVALEQAAAAHAGALSRLQNQSINAHNTELIAPVSGIIASKSAHIGAIASGGPLFEIIEGGLVEWQARISAQDAASVAPGTPVSLNLPDGSVTQGVVSHLAPVVNESQDVLVHVDLAQGALVGSFLTGEFLLSQEETLSIPPSALITEDGRHYVYVVESPDAGQSVVRKVNVRVLDFGEQVMIEGIEASAALVKEGGAFLKDGDTVRITSAPDTQQALLQSADTLA